MARSRGGQGPQISLFPFLSVLACVIGTLTLMIAAVAVGALGEDPWIRYDLLKETIKRARIDQQNMEDLIKEARDAREKVRRAKNELKLLEGEKEEYQKDAGLLAESNKLRERQEALETECSRIDEERRELEAKIEHLKEQSDEPQTIYIQPGGSGQNLKAFFAECTSDTLILYEDAKPTSRISLYELAISREFSRFISRVRSTSNGILIFLIRPDGVPLYDYVHTVANEKGVRNGKLPLLGYGPLDFSNLMDTSD